MSSRTRGPFEEFAIRFRPRLDVSRRDLKRVAAKLVGIAAAGDLQAAKLLLDATGITSDRRQGGKA